METSRHILGARRSTRLARRLPIRVAARSNDGAHGAFGAWTSEINQHGARLQSNGPMDIGADLEVTVLPTGRVAQANLVWAAPAADRRTFEFAIELHPPANIWGIVFPPPDWNSSGVGDTPGADQGGNRPGSLVTQEVAEAPQEFPLAHTSASERLSKLIQEEIESALQAAWDAVADRVIVATERKLSSSSEKAGTELKQKVSRELETLQNEFLAQCRIKARELVSSLVEDRLRSLSADLERDLRTNTERQMTAIVAQAQRSFFRGLGAAFRALAEEGRQSAENATRTGQRMD